MIGGSLALAGTLGLYLGGAITLGAGILMRRETPVAVGRWLAVLAAVLHTLAIGLRCAELHRAPFTTPAESLSLLAWLLGLFFLVAQRIWRLTATGPFALGLAFLLLSLAAGQGRGGASASPLLADRAISLHIIAIVGAFAAFALAFCCAALYLVQRKLLKTRNGLTWTRRLPPLLTVERAALALVSIGFPALTLGILAGMARAIGGGMSAGWQTDPKTIVADAVWVVYALYLWGRLRANWPPHRAALVLLAGAVLCVLAFLAPTAAHRFGA